jgi:DNA-binding response OmpR family regulator
MPRSGGPPLRPFVVIVEDDHSVAELYRAGLEASDFDVALYTDGTALFGSLDLDIPDLIVLDWQLGGILTGGEILKNLRLDERTVDVPVFFLSNHQSRLSEESGPVAWLIKARTTPADLAARLRLVLQLPGPDVPELGAEPT